MGAGFRKRLGSGKGSKREHFGDMKDIESFPSKSIVSATTKGRISPPATPDIVSSNRSRQTSTDNASEAAQEIVVWTEEMDIDSASQHGSDGSSELSVLDE
jgi:hypothetical protein